MRRGGVVIKIQLNPEQQSKVQSADDVPTCKPWAAIISLNRFLGPVDEYVTTN